ncbi:hypothetical protein EDD86DRAFT_186390 [Gorgonomyces haynaldii]|nr:hypothetical protein EDD86DRAFT_186390 [Gorgonomyces haynaldii]
MADNKAEPKMSLPDKYSRLVDPRNGNIVHKKDLEMEAKKEMKKVSLDLQRWVTDVFENSLQLDKDILESVRKLGNNQERVTSEYEEALMALERVDITGFNVLLNACKPSILEAKPPVRLNVVHDGRPDLEQRVTVSRTPPKKEKKNKIVLPPIDSSFTYRPKEKRPRPHYGVWYVAPKLWNTDVMNDQKEKVKVNRDDGSFRGVVQQRLDEITRKRDADQEQILRELERLDEVSKHKQPTSRLQKKK